MKKNILAVLLVFSSFAAFAGSSNSESIPVDKTVKDSSGADLSGAMPDSVDIRQMVLAQIDAAREKQSRDSVTALEAKSIQSEPVKAVVISQAVVTLKPKSEKTRWETFFAYIEPVIQAVGMSNELTIKITFMGTASFIVFLVVYVRRKRMNTKSLTNRNIKDGIKLIREEKVKDKKDSKLSLIRNKLIGSASTFQLSKDSVSQNARELNIAKGEIYLAARIKSHELKKASY